MARLQWSLAVAVAVAVASVATCQPVTTSVASVAICACAKDEHLDIAEWIGHHRTLGFKPIYVFDESAVPMYDEVTGEGVEHIVWTRISDQPQLEVYNECLKRFGNVTSHMAFIDVDEFVMIPGGRSLAEVLAPYAANGGLVMNWRQFGSSGHVSRPEGGVVSNYRACFEANDENCRHVKTIVSLAMVLECMGPHYFTYLPGLPAVNSRHEAVHGPYSWPPAWDTIYIRHYTIKSLEDFRRKSNRGSAMGAQGKTHHFFELVDRRSTAHCGIT